MTLIMLANIYPFLKVTAQIEHIRKETVDVPLSLFRKSCL